MLRLIRVTWLPTLAFAALGLLNRYEPGSGLLLIYGGAGIALLAVPVLWSGYVDPAGTAYFRRAALAGATVAFLIVTARPTMLEVWYTLTQGASGDGFGDSIGALGHLIIYGSGYVIDIPAGAALGAGIAWIQSRGRSAPTPPQPPAQADGLAKLTASLWAIILSPVLALAVSALFNAPLSRCFPRGVIKLGVLVAATWLVAVPLVFHLTGRFRARSTRA